MAKRKKAKTYKAKVGDKDVQVTVPENPDPTETMIEAIKDCLSPEAVTAIIAYLQPVQVKDKTIQHQVEWFSETLVKALGGHSAFNQLIDEIGL